MSLSTRRALFLWSLCISLSLTAAACKKTQQSNNESTPTPTSTPTSNDPLYSNQWHLLNTGQAGGTTGQDINVVPVWDSCGTGASCHGEGVRIAIVDDGLEILHEDLVANVIANQCHDYVTDGTNPTSGWHGTSVAGIVAARDANAKGGKGVAPRAELVGLNLLANSTDENEIDAMAGAGANPAISSNSWGFSDGWGRHDVPPSTWTDAINDGLTNGRSGKGTIYVFAAGNGGTGSNECPECVDNASDDGRNNHRGVISVAAVTDHGTRSSYSEKGACLLVTAPAGEFCDGNTLTTVDRSGNEGINTSSTAGTSDYSNTNYTKCMNGTSSATPIVSGVAALVLQANPNLGWRDVRSILARTARKNDATAANWSTNGAGLHFNPAYGFGIVDAAAAVALAKTWTNFGTEIIYTSPVASVNTAIPDDDLVGVSNTITVTGSGITSIEFIEVYFSSTDHTYSGDYELQLKNKTSLMTSLLAESHFCENNDCTVLNNAMYSSNAHLGEAADGDWELRVRDEIADMAGTFQSWRIKIYGH